MANTTETVKFKVESDIGQTSKDAKDLAGEFKIMGVSLNSVKAGIASVGKTAKASFATIRAGIMSTGIGALLIAVTALISYFTNTKRGADKLQQAMAGLGAVVSVITDLFSRAGETIFNAFSNPKEALMDLANFIKDQFMNRITGIIDGFMAVGKIAQSALSLDWDGVTEGAEEYAGALVQVATGMDTEQQKEFAQGFKDITAEIKLETAAMIELTKRTQELRDADNEFLVQKAKTRQEIEKARLIAEDETKSAKERLDNLKRALDLETQTTQKELQLARERMKVQEEEMALSENSAEDEAELARLRAQVIEVETASFRMRRRVITEVNSLENEIRAEAKARADEKKAEEEAELARLTAIEEKETERRNKLLESANQLIDEYYTKILDAETQEKNAITDKYFSILNSQEITSEQRVDLERAMQSEMTAISDKFAKQRADNEIRETQRTEAFKRQTVEMGFGALSALAGEDEKAQKAIAVAKTIFNTQQAIMNAMANVPAPFNTIQAIAAGVMGAKSIQTILSTSSSGGGGNSNVGAVPSAAGQAPSQQMVSGQFSLDNMTEPQPLQAYVVSDDITNNQEKLAAIRRRATI